MKEEDLDRLFREQIKGLGGAPEGSKFDRSRAWNKIEAKLDAAPKGGTGKRLWWMAAAAILLLAVGAWALMQPQEPGQAGNLAGKHPDTAHVQPPVQPEEHGPMAMESQPTESVVPAPAPPAQVAQVLPKRKIEPAPIKLHQEPLLNADLALGTLPDTMIDQPKSMVKVRVILGENKPDKEAVLHAEWEKQNRLRIEMHDQLSDRIRTGGEQERLPNSHSPFFHQSIDLNKDKLEGPRR